MSATDKINNTRVLTLTAPQVIDMEASVDDAGILHANRHQISVEGSAVVSFTLKGHTAPTVTTTTLSSETVIVFLLEVVKISVNAATIDSTVTVTSYSED